MSLNNEDSMDLPPSIALPSAQSNGVPEARRFENTGAVEMAVLEAVNSEEATVEALAKLILRSQPSSGGGGGSGSGDGAKDIKRNRWLAAVLVLVLTPGGMTATYYAVRDQGLANAAQVNLLNEKVDRADPKIEQNSKVIQTIQLNVSKIETSVDSMKLQQTAIAAGIESLKQVNVTHLEKENDKLERELRRERNNNR